MIIQPKKPSFIIPRDGESNFLDIEKAGLPTVPSHDIHDSKTTNKGETEEEKKSANII